MRCWGNAESVLPWKGLTAESQDIDLDNHERKLAATLETLPEAFDVAVRPPTP